MKNNSMPYINKKDIENKSNSVLEKFSKTNDIDYCNVPVIDILEFLGYDIDFRDDGIYSDPDVLGGLIEKTKTVELNAILEKQPGRLNFTIAHEIGHIVLHSDGNSKSFNRKIEGCNDDFKAVKKDPIEVQADMFAASLLMPSEAVIKSFYNAYITPVNVSKRSFSEYIFPRSKKSKMFRAVNRIQSLGSFQNVSKTALINRLIGLRLLKGIDFQKNKIKEY